MDKSSKIKELLRSIAGTDKARYQFRLMEVVSVDGDLCRARIDNFEIPGIRLSSIMDGSENGILITPSVGSIILVADISNGELRELVAIAYSEIDSLQIHKGDTTIFTDHETIKVEVGKSKIEVTDDLIKMNEGKLGGLIKINELTKQLEALKDTVNDLITSYNSHTHILTLTMGTGTAAPLTSTEAITPASDFDQEEYENPKITH